MNTKNRTRKKCDYTKQDKCIECPCGSKYQCKSGGETSHFKTNRHIKWVAEHGAVPTCISKNKSSTLVISPPSLNGVLEHISSMPIKSQPQSLERLDIITNIGSEDVKHFIQTKIKNNDNFKTGILDKIKYEEHGGNGIEDRSSQGFYYERLWDICIKFGVTNLTMPSIGGKLQTSHIINENPNKLGIKFNENCWNGNKLNSTPGGYIQQPVRSGNAGGYSDITFINKTYNEKNEETGEELCFVSVKYFKEEKGIGNYDIGKLCSLMREHESKNRTIKLYIFVNNKSKAIEKFNAQNISSNILIKYINPGGKYEHIYDVTDLNEAYFKLKKLMEQYNYLESSEDIIDFEKNYLSVLKPVFIPRFHQKLFTNKIEDLIKQENKNILIGSIPRSGKSYIMAGVILDYIKRHGSGKKCSILMMTPAPNETFNEYKDIFNTYIDFVKLGIDVIIYTGTVSLKDLGNKDRHSIIIISKQKLGWSSSKLEISEDKEEVINNKEDTSAIETRIKQLLGKDSNIDMMFLDEAHFGMSTENAKKIVSAINNTIKETIKIYVTATYNKPTLAYDVKPSCKLTWNMNDIKTMQTINNETINDNPIKKRFGATNYNNALSYFGDKTGSNIIEKLKKDYSIYPKPYLITSLWDKDFLNIEKLKIGDTDFGWDMSKLFATNGSSFVNNEQIKEIMRYYFGYPDKNVDYDKQSFYRTRGILPRIRSICVNKCRTLQTKHKTSQLWFLPVGHGLIKDKIKALVGLLTETNEFRDLKKTYHFFAAIDTEDNSKKGRTIGNVTYMGDPHDIKGDIERCEKKIQDGVLEADNLVIISGNRLQLGISLRNVDIVTLWNSTTSSDALFQMMFRSMTEVDAKPCVADNYCDNKRFGFMVDMNPQRALTNVNLFSENIDSRNKTVSDDDDDTKQYRQITDIINIDEDVFQDKYDGDELRKEEFVNELFNKLYTSWDVNVENVKKVIRGFSFDMDQLEKIKDALNGTKLEIKNNIIEEPKEDEMMPRGKLYENDKEDNKTVEKKKKKKPEINLRDTATEIIAEFISLLNVFTLYSDTGAKCVLTDETQTNSQIKIIDDIDVLKKKVFGNSIQRDIFLRMLNGRLTGKTSEPYPEANVDSVLSAMNNNNDKQVMNKIIISQKKKYYTINEPDELLTFINNNLSPKEVEKKENGEVFTPLSLVNEMLDKLDDSYVKEHNKSIFTDGSIKWLDPAVGIGNFPVIVYTRLMAGLKSTIKNEENRRKHILENMLYMSELTPKNVFICKKIFCGNTYKLNLYEGDSLTLDTQKVWGVEKFDVVMGNPPYNDGSGNKGKGHALWAKFVEMSLNKWLNDKGYQLFVHPSVWRQIEHPCLKLIKDRQLKYLEIHNVTDGQKTFKCATRYDWYVLKNEPYKTKTLIKGEDNKLQSIDLREWEFIPNMMFDEIKELIDNNNNDKLDVNNYRSNYGADKPWVSEEQNTDFKYPVVYSINKNNELSLRYSNTNDKGHFGKSKFIFSNGAGFYNDTKGEYGLTQWAYCIYDIKENLPKIEHAFRSEKFNTIQNAIHLDSSSYNIKVMKLFRKDFWKKFQDSSDKNPLPELKIKGSVTKAGKGLKIKHFVTKKHREGKAKKTVGKFLTKKMRKRITNTTVKKGGNRRNKIKRTRRRR